MVGDVSGGKYRTFWKSFLDVASSLTDIYNNCQVWPDKHYNHIPTNIEKVDYATVVKQYESHVELVIQRKADTSRRIFDRIKLHKAEIESLFGEPLRWNVKENRQVQDYDFSIEYRFRRQE